MNDTIVCLNIWRNYSVIYLDPIRGINFDGWSFCCSRFTTSAAMTLPEMTWYSNTFLSWIISSSSDSTVPDGNLEKPHQSAQTPWRVRVHAVSKPVVIAVTKVLNAALIAVSTISGMSIASVSRRFSQIPSQSIAKWMKENCSNFGWRECHTNARKNLPCSPQYLPKFSIEQEVTADVEAPWSRHHNRLRVGQSS